MVRYDKKYNRYIRINAHESSSVEGAFGHLTAFEHKEFCPQPYRESRLDVLQHTPFLVRECCLQQDILHQQHKNNKQVEKNSQLFKEEHSSASLNNHRKLCG